MKLFPNFLPVQFSRVMKSDDRLRYKNNKSKLARRFAFGFFVFVFTLFAFLSVNAQAQGDFSVEFQMELIDRGNPDYTGTAGTMQAETITIQIVALVLESDMPYSGPDSWEFEPPPLDTVTPVIEWDPLPPPPPPGIFTTLIGLPLELESDGPGNSESLPDILDFPTSFNFQDVKTGFYTGTITGYEPGTLNI